MKIAERTIKALGKIATGDQVNDSSLAPYQSGPKLVEFFNEFGANDVYGSGGGFPSRWVYAEEKLRQANGTAMLMKIIESLLDPRRFLGSEFTAEGSAEYLNRYLKYDGYEVVKSGDFYRVYNVRRGSVELEINFDEPDKLTHLFIEEQIAKCDRKIAEGDYDGAITNARSLLEGVLVALEERITGTAQPHGGDLMKLFKRVRDLLNLAPSRKDINESLRQLLSGLVSIVASVASLRNSISDAHAVTYRAQKHHAKLTVNSAKTVTDFLFETFEYQKSRGLITVKEEKVTS